MKRTIMLLLLSLSVLLSLLACRNTEEHPNGEEDKDEEEPPHFSSYSEVTSSLSAEESESAERRLCVCIDAGHQKKGIPEKEPNGPGSDVLKTKLSSGTVGVSTKIPEYVLTLEVSLMLKDELVSRGYEVVMIREDHDCPMSNAERAIAANESGADIFIRIHANGSSDPSIKGALTCAPTEKNEFLSPHVIKESIRLSHAVLEGLCGSTGAESRGIYGTDTMTGINWCMRPVTIVEMGYMSNAEEDELMATEEYRRMIVSVIADGTDSFFGIG